MSRWVVSNGNWETGAGVLRLATGLVDGIQAGLAARGFDDVRPAHGFAFVRVSAGPATTTQLAEHLGVTKQAASELVQYLVDRGYLTREPDPDDQRVRLLVLTDRGRACTRAAEQAAADTVDLWREQLPPGRFDDLQDAVRVLAGTGRLRPAW